MISGWNSCHQVNCVTQMNGPDLSPQNSEPMEDTVIASLQVEVEIKKYHAILCGNYPGHWKKKKTVLDDSFIVEMKKKRGIQKNRRYIQFAMTFSCTAKEWWYFYHYRNEFLKNSTQGILVYPECKTFMRNYVDWCSMDKDTVSLVKSCKGCTLAAKAPPIKFNLWPETDHPWSHLHIDFAGPLNSSYYLIIVDSFSKWPDILRCKKTTMGVVIGFLHKLFTRFRGFRFYCFAQCHPIYIKRIQTIL